VEKKKKADVSGTETKLSVLLKKMDHELCNYKSLNGAEVDKALLNWFQQQRSENVPVRSPLIVVKAEELAKLLCD
jgi:hypothetical protein